LKLIEVILVVDWVSGRLFAEAQSLGIIEKCRFCESVSMRRFSGS
jgi:hypothetical protein